MILLEPLHLARLRRPTHFFLISLLNYFFCKHLAEIISQWYISTLLLTGAKKIATISKKSAPNDIIFTCMLFFPHDAHAIQQQWRLINFINFFRVTFVSRYFHPGDWARVYLLTSQQHECLNFLACAKICLFRLFQTMQHFVIFKFIVKTYVF